MDQPTMRVTRSSSQALQASYAKSHDLPGSSMARRGTWQDGQWWCKCDPPHRATLKAVKKEGQNKGKLFWGCSVYPSCDFFLWNDQALAREKELLSEGLQQTECYGDDDGQESEEQQVPKTPTFTQKPLESFGIRSRSSRRLLILSEGNANGGGSETATASTNFVSTDTMREHKSPSRLPACPTTPTKRKRVKQENLDNEDTFSDLNSDDERELAELADDSAKKVALNKSVTDAFVTPTTNRIRADIPSGGLPTPPVSRQLFPTSDGRKFKSVSFEYPALPSDRMPTTPSKKAVPSSIVTRSGASNATTVAPSGSASDSIQDLADKIKNLIRGQGLDPTILRAVHDHLDTAVRRTKGIALGRERARQDVQQKEERIAKLQAKNRDLKTQTVYDRQVLAEAKHDIMALYQKI
ncbi:hypothetical protein E4U34_002419 [Claviceps purpurea]|nr:hypothetical protein E4U27_005491 [Claviceps purpurea]KAG6195164.1 hypothetical protein E4U10_002122 [Claviceps purpurea]KAG6221073.1 hypothetical protein E4U34_002419 [Claviceps purpurea]KAG6277242.1 hypothetical protein E4U47_007349 [Claviceps purpurea]KAG6283183.1 hypothetical protein E4U48_001540 [Claviceps purpurea]